MSTHRFAFRRMVTGDPLHTLAAALLDILVVGIAYAAALLLRFDADVPRANAEFAWRVVPFIACGYVLANLALGVYRTVWAYGSLGDIIALFRPVLLVTLIAFVANFWLRDRNLPLSVILIAGALIFPGMALVKMRPRGVVRIQRSASVPPMTAPMSEAICT